MARLALTGALTLAQLVDLLTHSQVRRHLGALPVLYALLETLQVRDIINRHCSTRAQVDHGTVALVLILNRLTMPLPVYQVADWLGRTVLVNVLGIPAAKFNDDRLGRTLDAIQPRCREIWQDVVQRALVQAEVDLHLIFYDLTAYILHGDYTDSQYVTFGFAHNTPMNKRKFKNGLNVAADGNIPTEYAPWSGNTADLATVQQNMEQLRRFLARRGKPIEEVMVVGDRANLNDELALAYKDRKIRYLAGLKTQKKVHRELLLAVPEKQFYAHPLTDDQGSQGYWGILCQVPFEHEGRSVVHRGLVVLSGPMRTAHRRARAARLRELREALREVEAKIGRPHYRTVKAVQKRAETQLKQSSVGKFMQAKAYEDENGQVRLCWWVNRYPLWQAMQRDGRYLLVTNDWNLSPRKMLALYRQKDGVEKRIQVSKRDLKVSPVYLHKDERIEAMLLINMLALLAYSLLERQARQHGLQMTTRRIIAKLQSLDVVETFCWDGSYLIRLVPIDEEQAAILQVLVQVLAELRLPRWPHPLLPPAETRLCTLSPPARHQIVM
ncbi:MAG: IS1634 family transposase [Chloroflexi bacterium]|nr:IS1634 family transposase [Chloroflexota bacterium]MBU1749457.1 IS1634 family transposase [Chloroflexota bacterium]MBU1879485.1 IS1634 family transposase [Chloroflexota bacterium]